MLPRTEQGARTNSIGGRWERAWSRRNTPETMQKIRTPHIALCIERNVLWTMRTERIAEYEGQFRWDLPNRVASQITDRRLGDARDHAIDRVARGPCGARARTLSDLHMYAEISVPIALTVLRIEHVSL